MKSNLIQASSVDDWIVLKYCLNMVQAFTFTIPAAEVPDILKEEALKQCIPIEDFLKLGLLTMAKEINQKAEQQASESPQHTAA